MSFTVDEMLPGRCPLAWIDEAAGAPEGRRDSTVVPV